MSDEQDGGPAFAHAYSDEPYVYNGMSLRDYFAAQALAGILSTVHVDLSAQDVVDIAASSYVIADAMLKARKR